MRQLPSTWQKPSTFCRVTCTKSISGLLFLRQRRTSVNNTSTDARSTLRLLGGLLAAIGAWFRTRTVQQGRQSQYRKDYIHGRHYTLLPFLIHRKKCSPDSIKFLSKCSSSPAFTLPGPAFSLAIYRSRLMHSKDYTC